METKVEAITYKVDLLGHLDLLEETSTNIVAEVRGIADREGVWSKNLNLSGGTAVQSLHAVDLDKGDVVAILETVTGLVQASDNTFLLCRDLCNHTRQGLLACDINHGESLAKVVEGGSKETVNLGRDEVDVVSVCELVDLQLLF